MRRGSTGLRAAVWQRTRQIQLLERFCARQDISDVIGALISDCVVAQIQLADST